MQELSAVPESAHPTMWLLVGEVTHRDGRRPQQQQQQRPVRALIG